MMHNNDSFIGSSISPVNLRSNGAVVNEPEDMELAKAEEVRQY